MDNTMSPAEISFLGAIAVTVVYILHRLILGLPAIDPDGFFITILVSSFIAQYIPLSIWKSRSRKNLSS